VSYQPKSTPEGVNDICASDQEETYFDLPGSDRHPDLVWQDLGRRS